VNEVGATELALARLDTNFVELTALTADAKEKLDRGRLEAAAVACQIAAYYAWLNHAGIFASPDLESSLNAIAHRAGIDSRGIAIRVPTATPAQVLHVATQVYEVGGHTQMLSRWISQDSGRRHQVCLTRQGATPVPQKLIQELAVRDDLSCLDGSAGGLLRRAKALRAAALRADLVLLHAHPYDVVPALAFAEPTGLPPVVMVNHSDHAFWIGRNTTTVLLNLRDSGRDLAIERRGVESARSAVLARPLGALTTRTMTRAEAKRQFGLSDQQVLIATAAAATKYDALSEPSLLDLVLPVIQEHPNAVFLAAGPDPVGQWADAERLSHGRIRALGRLADVTPLHLAADGYVDSFPFASLTSLIESGIFGNPALTYRGHPSDCGVLGADTRGLDEFLLRPRNNVEFHRDLSKMISDADWRHERGAQTRDAIERTHVGTGWQADLDDLYALAAKLPIAPRPGPAPRGTGSLDQLVELVQGQTGFSDGQVGAQRANLALLPIRDRVSTWIRLMRKGERPAARLLVPEWMLPPLSRARHRIASRAASAKVNP
jgi:hypothetical protein